MAPASADAVLPYASPYSRLYFGAPYKYVSVRAYQTVGGVTYYSNWVTVESAATV